MGQEANSGRNASLDEKKRRAAGRQGTDSPEGDAIRDFAGVERDKGRAGGAFGKDGQANREASGHLEGMGGGGADPSAADADVPPSTRPEH